MFRVDDKQTRRVGSGTPRRSGFPSTGRFTTLAEHGFNQEDARGIATTAAVFGMSNRLANVTGMRPNNEFYAMGR